MKKDIYKNPVLYYIAVPVAVALWPLLIWGVYLPRTGTSIDNKFNDYIEAQHYMEEILKSDPDRISASAASGEFDYATEIEKVASLCNIPSTDYTLSSGIIIKSGKQKSQNAKVILKQAGIAQAARFLSIIQYRWANLKCEQLKLTRREDLPDVWTVDIDFKYYY